MRERKERCRNFVYEKKRGSWRLAPQGKPCYVCIQIAGLSFVRQKECVNLTVADIIPSYTFLAARSCFRSHKTTSDFYTLSQHHPSTSRGPISVKLGSISPPQPPPCRNRAAPTRRSSKMAVRLSPKPFTACLCSKCLVPFLSLTMPQTRAPYAGRRASLTPICSSKSTQYATIRCAIPV